MNPQGGEAANQTNNNPSIGTVLKILHLLPFSIVPPVCQERGAALRRPDLGAMIRERERERRVSGWQGAIESHYRDTRRMRDSPAAAVRRTWWTPVCLSRCCIILGDHHCGRCYTMFCHHRIL